MRTQCRITVRSCTSWSLRNSMKAYRVNVLLDGIETCIPIDGKDATETTNRVLSRLDLPAEAWISTEEYTNG